jgi:hypothetical protein
MKDLIIDIVPVPTLEDRIAALDAQIRWLWSAIDEIWETMPAEEVEKR